MHTGALLRSNARSPGECDHATATEDETGGLDLVQAPEAPCSALEAESAKIHQPEKQEGS